MTGWGQRLSAHARCPAAVALYIGSPDACLPILLCSLRCALKRQVGEPTSYTARSRVLSCRCTSVAHPEHNPTPSTYSIRCSSPFACCTLTLLHFVVPSSTSNLHNHVRMTCRQEAPWSAVFLITLFPGVQKAQPHERRTARPSSKHSTRTCTARR